MGYLIRWYWNKGHDSGKGSRDANCFDINEIPQNNFKEDSAHKSCGEGGDTPTILFSGRLDNQVELAGRLGLSRFACTQTVLLRAYQKWGQECPVYLFGDFNFVVFDPVQRSIFAARDAMGGRPLYYASNQDCFALATSLDFLVGKGIVPEEISDVALLMYATGRYDDKLTPYQHIKGLDWGGAIWAQNQSIKIWQWWDPRTIKSISFQKLDDYYEAFLDVFDQCVRDCCQTDAPTLGSTLSGGMDSTSVTATARLVAPGIEVVPFSFRFNQLVDCDESPLSQSMADAIKLKPRFVNCESNWLFKDVLKNGANNELPFFSWETLDREILIQLNQLGGKVLLTGHGGDGLMTGINAFILYGEQMRKGNFRAGSRLKEMGYPYWKSFLKFYILPRLPLLQKLKGPQIQASPFWVKNGDLFEKLNALSQDSETPYKELDRQALFRTVVSHSSGVRRVIHYLLRLGEELKMECRHPFFDRRLVEFILGLSPSIISGEKPKAFLRKTMQNRLPDDVRNSYSKPHLDSFYKFGVEKEKQAIKLLMQNSILAERNIIDPGELVRALDYYLKGDPRHDSGLFLYAVMVESWLSKTLSKKGNGPDC